MLDLCSPNTAFDPKSDRSDVILLVTVSIKAMLVNVDRARAIMLSNSSSFHQNASQS